MSALRRLASDPRLRDPESLLHVAGYSGRIILSGRTWQIRCPSPAHEDRNPSCSLFNGREGDLRFFCHACRASGDGIDLVANIRFDGDLRSAIRFLDDSPRSIGPVALRIVTTNAQPIDERWRSRYSAIVEALLELCTLTPEVHAYLSKRAIADQAEAAGVRGLPSGSDELCVLEQLLTKFSREELTRAQIVADDGSLALCDYPALLPWRDPLSGALVLQRRAVDKRERKYLWARGLSPRRPHRFGATSHRIAAVEGWFDGIAMHALYPEIEVLAFPSASTVKEEWSALFANKDVLLAFDPDKAGADAVQRFIKLFGPSVRSLERMRPAFGDDWNECLVHMSGGRHVR